MTGKSNTAEVRRVLITGGLGYVGGRLARTLVRDASVMLRLGTRRPEAVPGELAGCHPTPFDLMDDAQVNAACEGMDTVVHLAAVNEIVSAADPDLAVRVNTLGTLRLLRAAERCGVRRFIFFSTAHVYGAPLEGVITERSLARPIHPYAITHRGGEDFVLASHDAGRIEGVVVRLSNGFGAPAFPQVDRWTLLANDLCRQAVEARVLTLRSSGLQWRDFIALEDVARATRHLIFADTATLGDGLFNLGGRHSVRVLGLAEHVAARTEATLGYRPEIRRPAPTAKNEGAVPLDYRIDKLTATGFALIGDLDAEIDATLSMCERAFG